MRLSVVIPALDEAARIETAVSSAIPGQPPELLPLEPSGAHAGVVGAGPRVPAPPSSSRTEVEVIVVDGGSADETVAVAEAAGARVVVGPRGRARQLQRGVEESTGDVVVFLHADSELPAGWNAQVEDALMDPGVAGGAFRFRLDGGGLGARTVELGVALRCRLFRLPYGDQAIFVRRRVLEACGGIEDVPLMEDVDLVRQIKRHGKLVLLGARVTTSARRYADGGYLLVVLQHALAILGDRLGFDRGRIAAWIGR